MVVNNPFDSSFMSTRHHDAYQSNSGSYFNINIVITKEISQISQTPKKLLYECAIALSKIDEVEGSSMRNNLQQMVSIQGAPSQRIETYMVEGLATHLVYIKRWS